MASEANIKAVITADDRASSVLRGFGNNITGVGDTIERGLKTAAVGLLAAGAATVAFGVSSVKAFDEAERGIAQTNAVLASTKGIAGVTADEVDKLSKALQRTTTYSDEEVRSAENLLLTFTAIGKDIFPQATKTVLNMATALGEDTKSASIQLGKALQDPILGVTALRRVGVNFNDAQKDVIKNLVETGRSAEAQRLILKELETEFGGSAEAAGNTFSGSLEKLKNQFNDVQEVIGKTIVDALTPLAAKLADFVQSDKFQAWLKQATEWLNVNLPKAINYVVNTILPALKDILDTTWPIIKTLIDWFAKLVTFLHDHEYVFWGIVTVFAAIKTAMFLQGALTAFTAVIEGAGAVFAGFAAVLASPIILPALAIAAVLASIAFMFKSYMDTKDVIEKSIEHVRGAVTSVQDAVEKLNNTLGGTPAQAERAQNALLKLNVPQSQINQKLLGNAGTYATGGFTGQGNANDIAGLVHKGEYVLPQNMVDQSTGLPKVGGGSVSININAGALMGTDVEARKFAQLIMKHYNDAMKSKSMAMGY